MDEHVTRRDALKLSASGPLVWNMMAAHRPEPAGPPDNAPGPEREPWYRRLLVGIEWGPTGANDKDNIYLSRSTGKQIIQHQLLARSQYAVVFMKDMKFAYYNSRLARKCPNLGQRDLLRECLDEASKHGMPVIAYCQVQYDQSSWSAHPEWRMKDSAGNDIPSRLCYNSGYLDYIKQIVAELLSYEISGLHIDMLDFGFGPPYGCWCPRCRDLFRRQYNQQMPKGLTWDQSWEKMLEFRCQSNTRFCRRLSEFIKGKRPDVSVDFNYHGYPPFSWETGQRPALHAANGDFVTAEGLPFIFGHDNPSLLALFMAGARPGGPIQGVTSRTVHGYHDFNLRPAAELKWEVFTYLAHGAQCTIVDKANYDGTLDQVAYRRVGAIFGEARRKQEFFGHPPLQEVGLYYSSRSRDWFGRQDPPRYMAAFWGAHKALKESHITMGMIIDENVSAQRLRTFPVVYLPGTAILTEHEVELLSKYVADGGCLLTTGLTGLYDRYGRLNGRSAIADLIGARLKRCLTEHHDHYLRFPASQQTEATRPLTTGIPLNWPMLTWGPMAVYEPAGAGVFGELMVAYRSQDNQWSRHMSAHEPVGPAVLLHRVGRGRVACVPGAVDAAFVGDFRMPEHRRLIRNLIRYLHPEPEVRIEAPPQVEAVVTRDRPRNRLLVHFLCFAGSPTSAAIAFPQGTRVLPPLMEQPAEYTARVRLRGPIAGASVAGPRTRLRHRDNMIELHSTDPHEVLIIRV